MRVLAPGQAGAVEQADGAPAEIRKSQSRCRCSPGFLQRRPDGADHQEQPEQQAGEERDLPDAAEVDVLVALVAPQ